MNIINLELTNLEYHTNPQCVVAQFKSKDANIKIATKDIDALEVFINRLGDEKAEIEIKYPKKDKKKYSSSSLRYYWSLITRISQSQNKSKDDVELNMRKSYGVSDVLKGLAEIDYDIYFKCWEKWISKNEDGKDIVYIKVYKDLSNYSQSELNSLIECVKNEAIDLDIDVSTPSEINLYGG